MAAIFLTLAQAKSHLRVTTTSEDGDIQAKLDQAEAMILARCNSTAWMRAITPTWTAETVPGGVLTAIGTLLTHLYEHRGDDMTLDEALWKAVDKDLGDNKGPVLA